MRKEANQKRRRQRGKKVETGEQDSDDEGDDDADVGDYDKLHIELFVHRKYLCLTYTFLHLPWTCRAIYKERTINVIVS